MRATYKLGRDVITEFEAQNAGNSISGVQISKHFPGGGGDARYWNEPRSRYEAGSAPGCTCEHNNITFVNIFVIYNHYDPGKAFFKGVTFFLAPPVHHNNNVSLVLGRISGSATGRN